MWHPSIVYLSSVVFAGCHCQLLSVEFSSFAFVAEIVLLLRVQNLGASQFWIFGSAWFRNVYTIFDRTSVRPRSAADVL